MTSGQQTVKLPTAQSCFRETGRSGEDFASLLFVLVLVLILVLVLAPDSGLNEENENE